MEAVSTNTKIKYIPLNAHIHCNLITLKSQLPETHGEKWGSIDMIAENGSCRVMDMVMAALYRS